MALTRSNLILMAGLGSLALLLGAFAFEYIGGYAPCKLCLWQRWPHGAAVAIALVALAFPWRGVALLGAFSAAATMGIGIYHAGVERGIFEGPTSCTGGHSLGQSAKDLLNQILAAPVIRCDDIPWELFGLSMAGWNAVLSGGLVLLWLAALVRG